MYPCTHIELLHKCASPETENVCDDRNNVVINTLDNVNSRLYISGFLEKTPADVNAFLKNPGEYASVMRKAGDAQARETLEHVIECIDKDRCDTFQDCITWARLRFKDYFSNHVKQLTFTFTEDAVISLETPFCSALKPAIIRADTFGISVPDQIRSPQKLAEAVDKMIVPEFEPRMDAKIVTDEKATNLSNASIDDARLESSRGRLSPNFRMNPVSFEKDDDTNCHMDMIVGLANTRSRNCGIPEVDNLQAKFSADKIVLAIATVSDSSSKPATSQHMHEAALACRAATCKAEAYNVDLVQQLSQLIRTTSGPHFL
ncbi:Ubiquitin-activating enzyme E1 1 [Bienertia sinuspersici]